jgi:hypothetical protein
MKKLTPIALIGLSLIILSFTKSSSSTGTDDLGNKIVNAIEQNDFESIKKMMVSTADIESTLDHFEMDEARKANVKKSLIEKIIGDLELTLTAIEKGFKDIREVFESKKCKKGVVIHKITPKTSVVNELPFEIGDLRIEFKCGKTIDAMNVEIIKTESGWYILEKLRLINK